ncbi:hypothetical protein J2Y89_000778 [Curtobacterium herbarum]|nr:hypothetical protein [Curtobacterium herbarum]
MLRQAADGPPSGGPFVFVRLAAACLAWFALSDTARTTRPERCRQARNATRPAADGRPAARPPRASRRLRPATRHAPRDPNRVARRETRLGAAAGGRRGARPPRAPPTERCRQARNAARRTGGPGCAWRPRASRRSRPATRHAPRHANGVARRETRRVGREGRSFLCARRPRASRRSRPATRHAPRHANGVARRELCRGRTRDRRRGTRPPRASGRFAPSDTARGAPRERCRQARNASRRTGGPPRARHAPPVVRAQRHGTRHATRTVSPGA